MSAGTSWAGLQKSHHTSHHKTKVKTAGVASCPPASIVSTAVNTTYTGPTTEKAAEKGWVICDYNAQGEIAVVVSLYTTDDSSG